MVLLTNFFTILLSLVAAGLAAIYLFVKCVSHFSQIVLGAAFSMGIPMAFSASIDRLLPELWLIYLANLVWTMVYDTLYVMVDWDDDVVVGIKSMVILFGSADKLIIVLLQLSTVILWLAMVFQFDWHEIAYTGIFIASMGFIV